MTSHYRPRRRPLLERLGMLADLDDRLAARLGPPTDGGLDVQDAVLRQDMEWLQEAAASAPAAGRGLLV